MAFTAHFYGGTPMEWLKEDINDIHYWYVEATKLHNKLNPAPESS